MNVSTNNRPTLCCTSRPICFAVPTPLTHSARGSNSAGPRFTSSALRFNLAHSSSCAAARTGLVRGSMVGNNLPLTEKILSIFRRRCLLRMGTRPAKSLSNLDSFETVRISTGSVTATTSVTPGNSAAWSLCKQNHGCVVVDDRSTEAQNRGRER